MIQVLVIHNITLRCECSMKDQETEGQSRETNKKKKMDQWVIPEIVLASALLNVLNLSCYKE